jgi:predicted kinase
VKFDPTIILMRGAPGSGKSTRAEQLVMQYAEHQCEAVVISTDDYFMAGSQYLFDPAAIAQAHPWNQRRCEKLMKAGVPIIIIDNTNTQLWEMREYVKLAGLNGYAIQFEEMPFAAASVLAERNKHGVPVTAIQSMLSRWEDLPGTGNRKAILEAKAPWERPKQA